MRTIVACLLGVVCLTGLVWAVRFSPPPPAEFTFSNQTEIKTVDPALVTGQPEGRIVEALFEGLSNWDPRTLEPRPGVAQRWELSDDKLTYTFELRPDALWSDGEPVTADDFVWSYRRMLHPATSSEYAFELWYLVGAEQYTSGKVQVGDPVELELPQRPPNAPPFASGIDLRGRLEAIEPPSEGREPVYTVQIDGQPRRFQKGAATPGTEDFRWLLRDFRSVGIEALDPHRLRFHLRHPVPYFVQLTGYYPFAPVNRRCLETHGYPAWTKPEHIVSNGAYLLQSRRIRDRLRLVKNPRYWDREHVAIETIDALAVESAVTAMNLYLTGQVDWVPRVPSELVPDLLRQPRDDYRPGPILSVAYYLINTRKPPLDDRRVRLALGMAVDKQEIVDRILRAGQHPARSLVPPEIRAALDYTPGECHGYDVDRAQQLLAEAGYPHGEGMPAVEILYNTDATHQAVAELIQAQWKRNLGVDARLQNQDWGRYLNSRRIGEFMVARAAWGADYISPTTFLALFAGDNPMNQSGWRNADYDRLLEQAREEKDDARRLDYFHQAEQILMDEMPLIPLFVDVSRDVVRPYVEGYYPNLLDTHPLKDFRVDRAEKARFERSGGER